MVDFHEGLLMGPGITVGDAGKPVVKKRLKLWGRLFFPMLGRVPGSRPVVELIYITPGPLSTFIFFIGSVLGGRYLKFFFKEP
jgi:hypothetical protein